MEEKWYLAGPFFNPEQVDLIAQVEILFKNNKINFFSPRIHAGVLANPQDYATRKRIFASNQAALFTCSQMLAVLTYRMSNGTVSGLPDIGTVWEMGHMAAQGKPVVGFYLDAPGQVNLMLTESTVGLAYGIDELERFLSARATEPRFQMLRYFTGSVE